MKKFSITKLEDARRNPIAFANTLTEASPVFSSNPKSVRWLTAVSKFHKTNDSRLALNYLDSSFANRKQTNKNISEVAQLKQALELYFLEYANRKYNYLGDRISMEIILSPKVKVTGNIWILNSKPDGGFISYTIVNGDEIGFWRTELRHPIIQSHIANNICKCLTDDVSVGIINYKTGIFEEHTYDMEDIDIAFEELYNIGNKITSVLK